MVTVRQMLHSAADLPGESPQRDAEILLGHCLGQSRAWLYTWPEECLSPQQEAAFLALLDRRRHGEPVAYITGQRDFWTLNLTVNEATLIPRAETETLVSWALDLADESAHSVLDLGTGSGAIALALASERPAWSLTAVDNSEEALDIARHNARHSELNGVEFLCSNWFDALAGRRFDLILANPPYVREGDPHLQCGDLPFEPRSALVAGEQGLADLAAIVQGAQDYLLPGGWLLTEHGFEQGEAVRELFAAAGFHAVQTRRDLQQLDRITGGQCRAD